MTSSAPQATDRAMAPPATMSVALSVPAQTHRERTYDAAGMVGGLAPYGNPFAQVFTRAHTHQFARTSLKRRVDTFTYGVPLYHLSNGVCP